MPVVTFFTTGIEDLYFLPRYISQISYENIKLYVWAFSLVVNLEQITLAAIAPRYRPLYNTVSGLYVTHDLNVIPLLTCEIHAKFLCPSSLITDSFLSYYFDSSWHVS